jgi:hypothetical protein
VQLGFEADRVPIPHERIGRLVFREIKRDVNEFALCKSANRGLCIASIHPCFPNK